MQQELLREHSRLQVVRGVIYAVSRIFERRDPYTAGHQRRVADLAGAIANEIGLSEQQRKGIHLAGLLHDVGKMVVPAEILNKPGELSRNEFSLIESHPQAGYDILENIGFPRQVTQAILQHHERLNGTGYPTGLSGKEIILEAKIVGVADVVDAMSSHRPYRPALDFDYILKEISQQRDILYDSEVVDACLSLFNTNGFALEKLISQVDFNGRETQVPNSSSVGGI